MKDGVGKMSPEWRKNKRASVSCISDATLRTIGRRAVATPWKRWSKKESEFHQRCNTRNWVCRRDVATVEGAEQKSLCVLHQ